VIGCQLIINSPSVYLEDVIERTVMFIKFHLIDGVYPAYDPVYADPKGKGKGYNLPHLLGDFKPNDFDPSIECRIPTFLKLFSLIFPCFALMRNLNLRS
jgi:hypothetical protein